MRDLRPLYNRSHPPRPFAHTLPPPRSSAGAGRDLHAGGAGREYGLLPDVLVLPPAGGVRDNRVIIPDRLSRISWAMRHRATPRAHTVQFDL